MRKRIKLIILLTTLLAGLSVTGLALAQSSTNFDLGCWGVITSTGGVSRSANYQIVDSLGQSFAGRTASPTFQVRIGYVQNWGSFQTITTEALAPSQGDGITLYFPVIAKTVRVVRQCSW